MIPCNYTPIYMTWTDGLVSRSPLVFLRDFEGQYVDDNKAMFWDFRFTSGSLDIIKDIPIIVKKPRSKEPGTPTWGCLVHALWGSIQVVQRLMYDAIYTFIREGFGSPKISIQNVTEGHLALCYMNQVTLAHFDVVRNTRFWVAGHGVVASPDALSIPNTLTLIRNTLTGNLDLACPPQIDWVALIHLIEKSLRVHVGGDVEKVLARGIDPLLKQSLRTKNPGYGTPYNTGPY